MLRRGHDAPSAGHHFAPARLAERSIRPAARDHYVRWAETWVGTRAHRSPEATTAFFDDLGRSSHLPDWQFRQAMDAVRLLAHEILEIPWAATYDWRGLADQARALGSTHRTLGRESIPISATLPPPSSAPLPETAEEVARITEALRRAIRLATLSYATEETYVHWNARFTRFCLIKLGRTPQDAGPPAITAYLNYLALERNVSPATQKQALNAMVFLTRHVFGIAHFQLERAAPPRGHRRPPVVLSRREIQAIVAALDGPWKLATQLMYGSGLRLMEALRLRVKDLDFDQGTITVHDGKGGKHRVVPLPRALESCLKEHLRKAREKHLQDLAVGAGDVHLPEPLQRKWPKAAASGPGSMCSPPPRSAPIPEPASSPATTYTNTLCSDNSRMPLERLGSPNWPPATPSVTPLPPICWSPEPTSGPSSPSWGTQASRPR
jgi:Phage integrase, N-terminal SAM-like domain/Phage integrase family